MPGNPELTRYVLAFLKILLLPLFILGPLVVTAGCGRIETIGEQLDSLRGTNTEALTVWVRKDSHSDKLIVFVHGFDSTNETAWGQFPSLVKDDDHFRGFNIVLFGYPTKLCSSVNSIHVEGDVLASFLIDNFRNKSPSYNKFVLVGHSMGGLVIMNALLTLDRDHFEILNKKDIRFLTFGTPYIGVENTDLLPPFCKSKHVEDMRVLNDGLHQLAQDWTRRFNMGEREGGRPTPQVKYYTYWGRRDRFVKKASACGYANIPCEAVDGDHHSIVKPETREHSAYTKLRLVSLQPPDNALLEPSKSESEIIVQGVMAVHLREQVFGPENVRFVDHRLGFIVKAFNPATVPKIVEVVILEGCIPIDPWFPREAFIDRDLLPEQLIFNEELAVLAKTAVQKIRMTGAVRADSSVLPPGGVGYVGVLLPLPTGKSGAKIVVEDSASLKGPCSKITKAYSQPTIMDLLTIGPLHNSWPRDLAQSFRNGSLQIKLHVGGKILTIQPSRLGKLYSLTWKSWRSLDLARMYEVPDTDYSPTLDTEK